MHYLKLINAIVHYCTFWILRLAMWVHKYVDCHLPMQSAIKKAVEYLLCFFWRIQYLPLSKSRLARGFVIWSHNAISCMYSVYIEEIVPSISWNLIYLLWCYLCLTALSLTQTLCNYSVHILSLGLWCKFEWLISVSRKVAKGHNALPSSSFHIVLASRGKYLLISVMVPYLHMLSHDYSNSAYYYPMFLFLFSNFIGRSLGWQCHVPNYLKTFPKIDTETFRLVSA